MSSVTRKEHDDQETCGCRLAAAVVVAVSPTAGNASVKACWNQWQVAPGFANEGTAGFFIKASPSEDYPWKFAPGVTSALAIKKENVPAAIRNNPLCQVWAGDYMLLCNAGAFIPNLAITTTFVDNNGQVVPNIAPYVVHGVAIPGLHPVAAPPAAPTTASP